MATLKQFVRRVPIALLQQHVEQTCLMLPPEFEWQDDGGASAKRFFAIVDEYDGVPAERFRLDIDRVAAMADEVGDGALYTTSSDPSALHLQPSTAARAYYSFLNNPSDFRRAEEARFADERRRGRNWDGFVSDRNLTVHRDATNLEAFQQSASELIGTGQVEVEISDRGRRRHDMADAVLVQATMYVEDRPNELRSFRDGRIAFTTHRPVHEAAITYEPETGAIEVVARTGIHRATLANLFAEHLMETQQPGGRVAIRQYRLEHLRRPHRFDTQPRHHIEDVRVKSMCLMPLAAQNERLTLELMRKAPGTIWDLAERRLYGGASRLADYLITRITLIVRFRPRLGTGRARVLPITVTAGTGCNIKDCTAEERLIGEYYMRAWGTLEDV
ncbi:hypothetical protein [Neoroseomonas lacus]|uniref:Uncharacterized protein n=1 Tax=Neoroseomonas lacus TaxID=287609 RepID=A0A917NY67_9PROT|nr:hypothetical protein [Neoroseomonas lacus]GGJ40808.1 hypothetical protein GCM10011320_55580 [Neoroseomonas lacus]